MHFLAQIPRVREIPATLQFLDDAVISGDEVADGWRVEKGGQLEAERFRFQRLYYDRYGYLKPHQLVGDLLRCSSQHHLTVDCVRLVSTDCDRPFGW